MSLSLKYNSINTLTPSTFNYFNIILLHMPRSFRWSLLLCLLELCIFHLFHAYWILLTRCYFPNSSRIKLGRFDVYSEYVKWIVLKSPAGGLCFNVYGLSGCILTRNILLSRCGSSQYYQRRCYRVISTVSFRIPRDAFAYCVLLSLCPGIDVCVELPVGAKL
jgi:hypothetical protein